MSIPWRLLNATSWLAVLIVNFLADSLPLFDRTTKEISAKVPTLVTPASYAFIIWGFIYLLLGLFILSPWLPSQKKNPIWSSIGPWFILSCLFNIGWIFLWHSLHFTSTVFTMIGLLATLIVLYSRTRTAAISENRVDRWMIALPFSIYLGWISVATIVNVSVVLKVREWSGWGISDETWAIVLLIVAGGLAFAMRIIRHDGFYPLVIAWALIAIGIEQHFVSTAVSITAFIVSVIVLLYSLFRSFRSGREYKLQSH